MVRQAAFFPSQGIKLKIGIVLGKPCMLLKKKSLLQRNYLFKNRDFAVHRFNFNMTVSSNLLIYNLSHARDKFASLPSQLPSAVISHLQYLDRYSRPPDAVNLIYLSPYLYYISMTHIIFILFSLHAQYTRCLQLFPSSVSFFRCRIDRRRRLTSPATAGFGKHWLVASLMDRKRL
jgi:hypothetical protein